LADDAIELLCRYHWPGNVRELENLVTRACVLHAGRTVRADDLRPWLIDPATGEPASLSPQNIDTIAAGMKLDDMERKLIEATLDHFEGHRAKAAQALGIGIRTLTNKLRAYGYAPRTKAFSRAA
jgi:DNA-binding NtrC family response regulator